MTQEADMPCYKCGSNFITNKTHNLCSWCNHIRLHGETPIETQIKKKKERDKVSYQNNKKRPYFRSGASKKRKETRNKDHEIYRKLFNRSNHVCEECGKPLPTEFEDDDGNLIAIWRYSHILGKKRWGEYRHKIWNFNDLCLDCHQVWDFGDKKNMKIYSKNKDVVLRETGKELL